MNKSENLLEEIEFVKKSGYKIKILKSLNNGVKIPTAIAKDTGILTNHISTILGRLKEHDLIECINPEVRKGRLYRLTDKGKKVVEKLE